jgi:hypothetical protein
MKELFSPGVKNKTLNILALGVLVLFLMLNVVHYYALAECIPLANATLWVDVRSLANSILINLLAAYLFFLLIVHLPTIRERQIIRNNLRTRYRDFKTAVIGHLLSIASGSYPAELVAKLCDIKEFRNYFKEDNSARWYSIANSLNSNESQVVEILVELEILRDEISFVLNKVEIHNEQLLAFFRIFSSTMYREERRHPEDDVKSLMQFMWQLFAGWSWMEGYAEKDVVQILIDKI